jgi:hypothetical protein
MLRGDMVKLYHATAAFLWYKLNRVSAGFFGRLSEDSMLHRNRVQADEDGSRPAWSGPPMKVLVRLELGADLKRKLHIVATRGCGP